MEIFYIVTAILVIVGMIPLAALNASDWLQVVVLIGAFIPIFNVFLLIIILGVLICILLETGLSGKYISNWIKKIFKIK